MKKRILTTSACLSLSLILISTGNTPSKNQEYPPEAQYVLNEVLVKFNSDISKNLIQDAVASVQGRILTYLGEDISVIQWDPGVSALRSFLEDPDLFYLRVPEYIGTERAISILKQNPNVIHAEKNGIWHACREPNETNFSKLWGLNNTGLYDGTTDADIDAPEAWDIFTGSSSIVVAVIDTGIDYNHEDLAANIWINSDETPGDGDDDDSNGYIDDIRGWDFVNNDNNPMDDSNPVYHGTHVAGTIGAMGNNGKGVVGVNWNVKIMPLKALHSDGSGPWSSIISAIDYSWKNGAHISNNSYGGYIKPEDEGYFVSEAIWRARTAGKLFVAAAGNYGWNIDESNCHLYPAFYTQDNIIAVAATSNTDGLPDYSNWGPTSVDLGAPGGSDSTQNPYNIYSTKKNNGYQYLAGTSMAAPHVAGVAALVWGYHPSYDYKKIIYSIKTTVDPKPSLSGKTAWGGRLNAHKAVALPVAPSNLNATGYCYEVKLTWQDNSNNEDRFYIYRKSGDQYIQFDYVGPNITTYWDTELPCGQLWCYRVSAYNIAGESQLANSKCAKTLPCANCGGGLSLEISVDKEILSSGEPVTYTFKLRNKGDGDLTDVELIDDQFGIIVGGLTLKKGEIKAFNHTAVLSEAKTNCA